MGRQDDVILARVSHCKSDKVRGIMIKKAVVLLLLPGLLSGCAITTPITPPTATSTSIVSAFPTQTPSNTFTLSPSETPAQSCASTPESTIAALPASEFNLDRFAQLGGSINGITISGDLAYIGMGPRVAAIDISHHEHLRLMGQSEPLPGLVTQLLQITGGPAPLLLVNAGKILLVVDTADLDELKPIHQLELEGEIWVLVWDEHENIVYVGGSIYQGPNLYSGFISAVSLTPNGKFKLLDSVAMPEFPLSMALGEGSLFAGAQGDGGGVYHVLLKAPGVLSTPQLVLASTPEEPLQPMSMQVIGKNLYLGYNFLEAYDITHPAQPVRIWRRNPRSVDVIDDFILTEGQIYLFGWTIMSEYVREAMAPPQPITGSPMGKIAAVTAMHNGDFLVAHNDLEIYDTSNPDDLQLVGSYLPAVTNAIGAAVNERAIYVVDEGTGDLRDNPVLRVLGLPDLKLLGQVRTEAHNSANGLSGSPAITLDGDRLYLADFDNIWAYDVSHAQPVLLGRADIVGGQVQEISAIRLGERRLLATSQVQKDFLNVLAVYDLTDLQKPARLGEPLTLGQTNAWQMVWNGFALYLLLSKNYSTDYSVNVINFDNNVLARKDSLELEGYIRSMAVDNKFITLTGMTGHGGGSFFSTVVPGPLRLITQTAVPEVGTGVAITGEKALIVVGTEYGASQLLVYNVSDPTSPRQVQAMDISVSNLFRVSIFVTGVYVILVNGSGGVDVFCDGS